MAVTDDKVIHVFSVGLDGALQELSERAMPKRPCAIQVLPDNATIICGDKFGDVYSLSLLPKEPSETADATAGARQPQSEQPQPTEQEKPAFKPSATNLTVHTKRNLKALQAQQNQKNFSARKEPLKFEHSLLLGHVSMLTDAVFATRVVEGKERGFIITADRDEHIRISRGPPQSHVIEGFCLGHKEFVSKLCVIPKTDLLVSGGGDEELFVWNWPEFKLLRKFDIAGAMFDAIRGAKDAGKSAVEAAENAKELQPASEHGGKAISMHRINISGLWTAPFANGKGHTETLVLVASERMPALFAVPVNRLQLKKRTELTDCVLAHPPLDVVSIGNSVLVSLDCRSDDGGPLIHVYKLKQGPEAKGSILFDDDEEMMHKLSCLEKVQAEGKFDDKKLDDLLYGVASLRKRKGEDVPRVPHGDDEAEEQAMGVEGYGQMPKGEADI